MEWTLNLAEATDYDTVYELVSEFHATENIQLASPVRASAVRALLGNDILGNIWLINGDGACAGYIALGIGFSLEFGGRDAFIDELYLRAPYRAQGGGRFAIESVIQFATRRGIKALHLEVERGKTNARRLYASCGLIAREDYVLMSADLPSAD
jgi:GNAT superfamily N-acetyltransferase